MTHDTDVQKRIDRTRSRGPFDVSVVETDPTIVRIESSSRDIEHTLVPEAGYCGCEDAQYRQCPCLHILYLALDPDDVVPSDVRERAVSGLQNRHDCLVDNLDEIQQRLDTTRERAHAWAQACDAVGVDTDDAVDQDAGSADVDLDDADVLGGDVAGVESAGDPASESARETTESTDAIASLASSASVN